MRIPYEIERDGGPLEIEVEAQWDAPGECPEVCAVIGIDGLRFELNEEETSRLMDRLVQAFEEDSYAQRGENDRYNREDQ